MKRVDNELIIAKRKHTTFFLLICFLLFSLPCFADYDLTWATIDGGGGTSSGGQYTLTGTIGQPDAGAMSGGNYELLGGFWPGGPLCLVEFGDYARFAEHWLDSGSGLPGDLDGDLDVDFADLKLFVDEWLYTCPYNWPLK